MSLTAEHVRLLRETWAVAAQDPEALTGRFYTELFRREPGYRRLFAGSDLKEQQRKLAAALGLVVKHAADLRPVIAPLEDLGRRHTGWGVVDADYDVVGGALVHALSETLGDRFRPSVQEAWVAAYTAVADTMKGGARSSLKKTA